MNNYRVVSGRWDSGPDEVKKFRAKSDRRAKTRFKKDFVDNKNYSWDHLKLVRILKSGKEKQVDIRVLKD